MNWLRRANLDQIESLRSISGTSSGTCGWSLTRGLPTGMDEKYIERSGQTGKRCGAAGMEMFVESVCSDNQIVFAVCVLLGPSSIYPSISIITNIPIYGSLDLFCDIFKTTKKKEEKLEVEFENTIDEFTFLKSICSPLSFFFSLCNCKLCYFLCTSDYTHT